MFDGSSIAGWKAINDSRHAAGAGLLDRGVRPVCGADLADHLLRRARAVDRPALWPRPALDREEGRAPPDLDRDRRQGVFRARGRVFHLRRCALQGRHERGDVPDRQRRGPLRLGQGIRRRQYRPPAADQGRLFPGAAGRRPLRSARRDALGDGRYGASGGKAPSRGGALTARAGLPVFHPGRHRRQYADLQIRGAQRRPAIRQDRDLHAQADQGRQRLGHACAPIPVEGRQHAVRRQPLCRSVGNRALLYRRHHQARQGDQRLHQPDHQQLQAADPGLRGAGAAGLFLAQPLGLAAASPMSRAPKPNASRCAFPTRRPTPIWPLRR